MAYWNIFSAWFFSLGKKYNVDPLIFGAIYVGAIPFFFSSMYWLVKRIRSKQSIFLPLLATGFFFISAYLYLIIVGQNIPVWVYVFIGVMIVYGLFTTTCSVKKRLRK